MPHVVVEGPVTVSDFYSHFTPMEVREESAILKASDIFLNAARNIALVDALVVEEGPPKRFFVQLTQGEGRVTLRLSPATDPEKTRAVKRMLMRLASSVKSLHPDCRYGKTNLGGLLADL